MDRRNFLKTAAAPIAVSALTLEVVQPKTVEASVSKRINKFMVVLFDGEKPVSEPMECRFEMGDNYCTSIDSITVHGNKWNRNNKDAESYCITHIGLGEFKVPLDSGPEEIGPYDTFVLPSINFSFGEKL